MGLGKIRVLICDDSALVRQILSSILASDPQIEVVGVAQNPLVARTMIKELNPDVLTLDIEMPQMDGLSFLEKIMTLRPMPVVMISSLTQEGTAQSLKALELGVYDVIGKPTTNLQTNFKDIRDDIITKVKGAATARIQVPVNLKRIQARKIEAEPAVDLIAIGASTGGVVAIKEILPLLPKQSPPVIIVQHMPEAYTAGFAARLDTASRMTVVESEDGMKLVKGTAYLARGGTHLRIVKQGHDYIIQHGNDAEVSGHKPSVDAAFESIAANVTGAVIAVILTGMGRDGARGMLDLRRSGAFTIGQSQDSCVVYGMPRVAKEVGGVVVEMPLSRIAAAIEKQCWPI
ncbi:protein-glutamate methylesterase/protein-glutamine glutaminase [Kordiimonas pumila]|uniref:Protein-glutamate methylesterase/protein-glutamine glutaminase n=1 Tax=Kordiimonas pumila TaxID=2161677 RepID=A0ABV7D1M0_9PROT|nr:chemotaxis response regulator protein-glutamate methylesterase [Kordiimonas pumila]